jgi:O-antigen/teichoic acid export membrane protein
MLGNAVELSLRQVYYTRVTQGDRRGQRRVLTAWVAAVAGAGLVLLVLIALLHRQVAAVLLAPSYRAYSGLMIWIGAGYTLAVCAQVIERVCYALHDTRGVLLIETGGAVFSMAVGVPMVMAYGVRGAAWAAPLYFGLQLLLAAWRAGYASRLAGSRSGATSAVADVK